MKVLNLYAGLGGNRKLWKDCEVTAVEMSPIIAKVYSDNNPDDEVIVGDAHQYLLDHHDEFDFIWSSPPCQSHSKMTISGTNRTPRYPDMKLYEEILFLNQFYRGKWVVENVVPYYDVLIPASRIGRHLFWSNFFIQAHEIKSPPNFMGASSDELKEWLGIQYEGNIYYGDNHDPMQVLRNCVHPELGALVFECSNNRRQQDLF